MYISNYQNYRKKKRVKKLLIIFVIILLFCLGFASAFYVMNNDFLLTFLNNEEVDNLTTLEDTLPEIEESEDEIIEEEIIIPFELNSLYFDVSMSNNDEYLNEMLNKFSNNEINSVVIPVKNRDGSFNYFSQLEYDTVSLINVDLTDTIKKLCSIEDLYVIASVSMYGDDHYAYNNPTTAVKASGTNTFYDTTYERWITPYSEQGHLYLSDVLTEVKSLGFDEIMLNHMSFPAAGKLYYINYAETDIPKEEILTERLKQFKTLLGDFPLSLLYMPQTLLANSETYEHINNFSQILDTVYAEYIDETTLIYVNHLENRAFIINSDSEFTYTHYILK